MRPRFEEQHGRFPPGRTAAGTAGQFPPAPKRRSPAASAQLATSATGIEAGHATTRSEIVSPLV